MAPPTLERLQTPEGVIWRVSYAGMVRYHHQDWQAFTFYEMARAAYAAHCAISNPSESADGPDGCPRG